MKRKQTEGRIVCDWIETHCRVPSGSMVGQALTLAPFQPRIIRGIYDAPCRRAIISFGRKSGKTTLSALLMLVDLCGPKSRQNGRLYSTALSRGQARAALSNVGVGLRAVDRAGGIMAASALKAPRRRTCPAGF